MSDISDYDRAISAYQFQVERYHTWMNYYSIFEGALLVAFYSIDRCTVGDIVYMLIPILGFIVSLCWLGSIIGHRCWMNSWLNIVKYIENKDDNIERKIYNSYSSSQKKKYFLSTQGITKIFILIVIIAWGLITINSLYTISNDCFLFIILGLVGELILIGYAYYLYEKENNCIHSDLSKMKPIMILAIMFCLVSCTNNAKTTNNSTKVETTPVTITQSVTPQPAKEENKELTINKNSFSIQKDDMNILLLNILRNIIIEGRNITENFYDNPMIVERWKNETLESDKHPFVFIKAKITDMRVLAEGCEIEAANCGDKQLCFYVAKDEDLYELKIGDIAYFWALPEKVGRDNFYFGLTLVAATEYQLVNKISNIAIYLENIFREDRYYNQKELDYLLKTFYYEGITFTKKELSYLELTLGSYVGFYKAIYDNKKDMDFNEFINKNIENIGILIRREYSN